MAGIAGFEPKYDISDDDEEILNELNLDDELDGAGGLTLNGE
jgi:hypothetical protein